jgi:hypothetical protein
MKKSERLSQVAPLDWVDENERWILTPGAIQAKSRRRLKELSFSKNNCLFAKGVPKSLFDFIYRARHKLNLKDKTLIFTKGVVRNDRSKTKRGVSIRELDWNVGILMTIPSQAKYREFLNFTVGGKARKLRQMELIVLHGLLRIAYPHSRTNLGTLAVVILAQGWPCLHERKMPAVRLISNQKKPY